MMSTPPVIHLRITGMDCADCAKTLEKGVGQLDGVQACRVSFMNGSMEIEGTPNLAAVHERIQALGYGIGREAPLLSHLQDYRGIGGFLRFMLARTETALALLGAAGLLISIALSLLDTSLLLVHALQLGVILLAGFPIARRGVRQLIISRDVTINLLMSIATVGALLIGEWEEAATVILLFAIGEALEGYTADRARGALHSLLLLSPPEASVMRSCIDCEEHLGQDGYTGGPCPFCGTHEQRLPVGEVALGETILIRPAERIPLDGIILEGSSAVNEAPITGESLPIDKGVGERVFAGSVNGSGALHVQVTSLAQDSTLSRIIRLVEAAQAQKAPAERFVDRFAKWYTPAVVALAGGVALIPPLLLGAEAQTWLYRALALLVVACPCALVISTPVTVVSAMVRAARQGILIKGGAYLEALGTIKVFAFDKTGTLTNGQPRVVELRATDCADHNAAICPPCEAMLALASAVERHSEHPLGQAIVQAAREYGVLERHAPAQSVTALTGRGIRGEVEQQPVTIGSHLYFDEHYPHQAALCEAVTRHEQIGQTVMLVAAQEKVLGFISVADTPRPSAKTALSQLHDVHKIMLTGDNLTVAEAIAAQVGIDEVKANLLPEDKARVVGELVSQYGAVAMLGDGINDAPALAAASVGVAMGGAGTAQAMETADVVLMRDDLSQLPNAVHLSRRAVGIIRQNIALSLLVKAIFVVITLIGASTLWMAVFADMGMSLLVTFNGMRLLRNPSKNLLGSASP